ncbi:hypothetical protein EDC01DRAFT_775704 [Geopyxis carbonaria]|nr:hypothetical protein EDC01DRAFT_775704 [Geopyxis carbonaria]
MPLGISYKQHQQQNTLDKPEQLNSSISRDAAAARSQIQERAIRLFFDDHGLTPKGDFHRRAGGYLELPTCEADGDGEADVEFHWDDSSEVLDGPVKPGTMYDGGMNISVTVKVKPGTMCDGGMNS